MPTLIDRRGRRNDVWLRPAQEVDGVVAAAGAEAAGAAAPGAAATRPLIAVPAGLPSGAGAPQRHLLLPLVAWLAQRETLLAELAATGGVADSRLKLGVELAPADDLAQIAADLPSLSLISVEFPRFTDGRGYSIARALRGHYHWQGEIRAVGDILRDQLFYLARCGFDTFALRDDQNVDVALRAFRDFSEAYQGAVDRGPLFERRRRAREIQNAGS